MKKKQWLWIFLGWLFLGILIGGSTFLICGSFKPILYGYGYPEYSLLQKGLFLLAQCYAWPVTQLFILMEKIRFFDMHFIGPFSVEILDVKLCPFVVVLYALFWTCVTVLLIGAWRKLMDRKTIQKRTILF